MLIERNTRRKWTRPFKINLLAESDFVRSSTRSRSKKLRGRLRKRSTKILPGSEPTASKRLRTNSMQRKRSCMTCQLTCRKQEIRQTRKRRTSREERLTKILLKSEASWSTNVTSRSLRSSSKELRMTTSLSRRSRTYWHSMAAMQLANKFSNKQSSKSSPRKIN